MIAQALVERLRLRGAARRADRTAPAGATARNVRGTGTRARERASIKKRRLRRARLTVLATVAAGILLAGAWAWVRHSPLVRVHQVTASGQRRADAAQIPPAPESAARTISRLDLPVGRLPRAL